MVWYNSFRNKCLLETTPVATGTMVVLTPTQQISYPHKLNYETL